MLLGIALGVAVAVAIDLANASAGRAFELSTETVAGRATHQITGGPSGIDEELYVQLKRQGLAPIAAPVVTDYVSSPELEGRSLQLLGVDPFAEPPFRDYMGGVGGSAQAARPSPLTGDLGAFLTQPGTVFISTELASRYGLQACSGEQIAAGDTGDLGCRIFLEIGGRSRETYIAGLLEPSDALSRRALESLVLTDISSAQEFTGRTGTLDRIDLILPDVNAATAIAAALPRDLSLTETAAQSGVIQEMTEAFHINLTALSLLALVVGMFLIYNTMTFSVVQRRAMFGALRALGVTRREIFLLVMGEAFLVGLLGSSAGLALGVVMGQGAVDMVSRTINDLFFVLDVQGVQIQPSSLVKGAVLGIAATLLSAAPPAWEAATSPPRATLTRSTLETKARRAVRLVAQLGFGLLVLGAALLALPAGSLRVAFAGTFAVIVGLAALAPLLTGFLVRGSIPVLGALLGTLGRMAPREVIATLSRTAVAVSALMVAVSVTIGVSLMVSSFRYTVVQWLEQTLLGDVYISAPGLTQTRSWAPIDPNLVSAFRNRPEVARQDVLRSVLVDSPYGPVHIAASDSPTLAEERIYLSATIPPERIQEALPEGAVIVSEPLARRLGLPLQGGQITLRTPEGDRDFAIAGVFYDYASTEGTVMMSLPLYQEIWEDPTITAIALRLEPGVDVDEAVRQIQVDQGGGQELVIRANSTLRTEVLEVFDRTFAITFALQLLATIVAFIGVLSALLSLELERQWEFGLLRAVGLTVRQLWALILLETGLLGAVAGVLSMPTGYVLALILVYIINRRSFGWTLQMRIDPEPFIIAGVVALSAALLAAVYPALRIGRMQASDALRSE